MKINLISKVISLSCLGAFASCSTTQPARITVSAPSSSNSKIASQLFETVNAYRVSKGKSELIRHSGLDQLARNHCEYLRKNRGKFGLYGKNVSHWGFEGRAVVAQQYYNVQNISENVAAAYNPGSGAANSILKLWQGSTDHKYNLRSSWSHTGIGVVVDSDGTVFATQLFATMKNSQMATRERFNHF
jgi:uncharacterized protein YkwD